MKELDVVVGVGEDFPQFEVAEANTEKSINLVPANLKSQLLTIGEMRDFAEFLSQSTIVPDSYYGNPANCLVALEMSGRMGVSFMVVMQNLYIVLGKPSWSGSAIGAMLMASPKFKDVELEYSGERGKTSWGCRVVAKRATNGKEVIGATVTLGIAQAEGWLSKGGSKWKTMPELMLAYRAYAWFARVHAPELLLGMQTSDEIQDVHSGRSSESVVNPFE